MGKNNHRFLREVSILSPISENNGYPMRIAINRSEEPGKNIPPAFRTLLIDAPPIFTNKEPFVAEPGFNGDDETWLFTNHGKSIYVENPDIMAVGCSITSSVGIPRKYSWPQIVSAATGETVNVCSRPASGIMYQIYSALQMMAAYGKPKKIFALFPDIFRAWVNVHGGKEYPRKTIQDHLVWSSAVGAYVRPKEAIRILMEEGGQEPRKASVFTYRDFQGLDYPIPAELVIAKNFQAITVLETFCEINSIELAYCSWSAHANKAFADAQMKYFKQPINTFRTDLPMYWSEDGGGYEYTSPREFICPDDVTCGHIPTTDEHGRFWVQAENDWHPGIHSHLHIAEMFLNKSIDFPLVVGRD